MGSRVMCERFPYSRSVMRIMIGKIQGKQCLEVIESSSSVRL